MKMPGLKLPSLKGKDKYETVENWSIVFICLGAAMLAVGLGATVLTPKGVPVILAALGSMIAFVSVTVLIFTWLAKELFGE